MVTINVNMEKLSMCRICLSDDVQLNSIVNTYLQVMYESLTMMPFVTEDRSPILACDLCCAKLKDCHELRQRCIQSETLFTQLLRSHALVNLQILPDMNLSMEDVLHEETTLNLFGNDEVKQEDAEDARDDSSVSSHSGDDTGTCSMIKMERDVDYIVPNIDPLKVDDSIQSSDSEAITSLAVVKKESDVTAKAREESDSGDDTDTRALVRAEVDDVMADALIPEPPASAVQMSSDASTSRTLEHTGVKYQASERLKVKRSLDPRRRTREGEKPYQCEECDKCFSIKQYLVVHCRTHTGEKPFKCTDCNKCFSEKSHLNRHIRTHTGEKPFKCTDCNKCFSDKSILSVHIRMHNGEEPFKCTDCDKCFSDKSNLKRHSRTHTGEKPFKCTDCNKCFREKSILSVHIRMHNGEKPFKCTDCDKCFSNKSNLKRHSRTHTGEKPFKCTDCNKCFSEKSILSVHIRMHNGEKPFKCTDCDKCFSNKSNLKRHSRTHTGEKPFKCTDCDKCFSKRSYLIKHIRVHNGEKPF